MVRIHTCTIRRVAGLFAALIAIWMVVVAPAQAFALASVPDAKGAGVSPQLGVGVTADPLRAKSATSAGGRVAATPLFVVNTGNEPETITLTIRHLDRSGRRELPEAWVRPARSTLELAPGKSATIPIGINVPADVTPNDYATDLVASAVPVHLAGASVKVGAAAAAVVYLTVVGPGSTLAFPWRAVLGGGVFLVALMTRGATAWRIRRKGRRRVAGEHVLRSVSA